MIAYSLVVIIHNIIIGVKHPAIGIEMLCVTLRIILNLADIIAPIFVFLIAHRPEFQAERTYRLSVVGHV